MKKILIISIIAAFFSSCNLLDVEPHQSIDAETAINNQNDVENAITGVYDAFQSSGYYGRNYILINDLAADNLFWSGTTTDYKQFEDNAITANNGIIDGIWVSIYDAINRANIVLSKIDDIEDVDEEEAKLYKGELLFLRGLAYFDLVKLFGGVPLRVEPIAVPGEAELARSSVGDVYTLIIEDLTMAKGYLAGGNLDPVKASDMAATALLAKVYLFKYSVSEATADLDSAVANATEVIKSGLYDLPSFETIFPANESTESIFEIDFNEQDYTRLAQYVGPISLAGRQEVTPTSEFDYTYTGEDLRLDVTIKESSDGIYCGKYVDIAGGTDNVYVLRLAEMYLIRAEANNLLGKEASVILPDIEQIRTRAGLTTPLTISSQDELALEIETQRRLELALEGNRWPDLVRTNRAIEVKESITSTDQYLFPIPLSEMNTNSLIGEQNSGY